eukprot:579573-Amphidinium_carterae.1
MRFTGNSQNTVLVMICSVGACPSGGKIKSMSGFHLHLRSTWHSLSPEDNKKLCVVMANEGRVLFGDKKHIV